MKVSVVFFINAIFLSGLLFLFVVQSWQCLEHYIAKETSVQMAIGRAEMGRFPSIGIGVGWNKSALGEIVSMPWLIYFQIFQLENEGLTESMFLNGTGWDLLGANPEKIMRLYCYTSVLIQEVDFVICISQEKQKHLSKWLFASCSNNFLITIF